MKNMLSVKIKKIYFLENYKICFLEKLKEMSSEKSYSSQKFNKHHFNTNSRKYSFFVIFD